MSKSSSFYISIALAIILGLVVANYIFGWTTPSANPPSSNLPAPINSGSDPQHIAGYLAVGTSTDPEYPLDVAGVLRIGRFSTAPSGANGALYYDTTENKFKGYQSGSWSDLGGSSLWTQSGDDIYYDSGKVGIGTSTPSEELDVSGDIQASGQLKSTVAAGTAPLVVSSDTKVTNLNADKLDGYDAADLQAGGSGYIDWSDCEVKKQCIQGSNTVTLTCSSGYTLVVATCHDSGYHSNSSMRTKCYLSGVNTLTLYDYKCNYGYTCGSIKCCKYIAP